MNSLSRNTNTLPTGEIHARQIAFFAAFILPMYKIIEAPSLLARYANGDLLLPALLHYLLQTALLLVLLYAAAGSEKTLFERMEEKLGKLSVIVYIGLGVYFLFFAVLPLLDLEKFVYAVFYDTSPTLFSFAFFFVFCAFVCTKGIKALGRAADVSLFLFLFPFLLLLIMSLAEADASNLMPLFQQQPAKSLKAFSYTVPHFSDVALLLPLIGNLRYKKGDGGKIVTGYGLGAVCTLVFLAVFYGVYSTIAAREHYAFAKIAQYFPALSVVGRIDLLLVYLLCVVLFIATATPLAYASEFTAQVLHTSRKTPIAAALSFAAFLFVLFCNKYYNRFYAVISGKLFPVFLVVALSVFFLLFLCGEKTTDRTEKNTDGTEKTADGREKHKDKKANKTKKDASRKLNTEKGGGKNHA